MGFPYTIRSGDTLTSIARRNGLASWRDLYYLPENATFRTKRPNPDRIFPGDVLMIPGNASTPIVEQVTGPEMVAAFLTLSDTRQRIVDIAKAEADLGHAPFGTVTDRLTDPGNRNFPGTAGDGLGSFSMSPCLAGDRLNGRIQRNAPSSCKVKASL